ncbi:MAG: hypothetical protein E7609_07220 [Ruminococcaceae bacterium]|nr:hypothetical protein [Oscillospiraceae bacterium]
MAIVTIIGAGMMGSALAFPARENGNEVRLVGTPLDREIIDACKETGRHPKFTKGFPAGVRYYQVEEMDSAIAGAVHGLEHKFLSKLKPTEMIHEVLEDRRRIEEDFGVITRGMAYAYSDYSTEAVEIPWESFVFEI